jgi:hypothetical protein
MPGPLLHLGASLLCAHGGMAQPTSSSPRVLVSGQPVVTLGTSYVVAGCGLSGSGGPFCTSAQFVVGATRVLSGGRPVLLTTSTSVCIPTGTPLLVASSQARVRGT